MIVVGVVPSILFVLACLALGAAAACMDLVERYDQIAVVQSRLLEMLKYSHVEVRCYISGLHCCIFDAFDLVMG